MAKQFKNKDIQEAINIKKEDESKQRIKDCRDAIEEVLKKYNCTIYPTLQMVDNTFVDSINKESTKPAAEIKK
jgi:hypothetical protein